MKEDLELRWAIVGHGPIDPNQLGVVFASEEEALELLGDLENPFREFTIAKIWVRPAKFFGRFALQFVSEA